jgi:hypothetical protein
MTIYGSIEKYSLPATSNNEIQMTKIQQPVIRSVLSRLGFNPHMPRVVVHASTQYAGDDLLAYIWNKDAENTFGLFTSTLSIVLI